VRSHKKTAKKHPQRALFLRIKKTQTSTKKTKRKKAKKTKKHKKSTKKNCGNFGTLKTFKAPMAKKTQTQHNFKMWFSCTKQNPSIWGNPGQEENTLVCPHGPIT